MNEPKSVPTLPQFTPALESFRAEEFLALTESLLAIPVEHDAAALIVAPFRLTTPETTGEPPLPALPPRWYPRPDEAVIEAARALLVPPKRPAVFEGRGNEVERVLRPLVAGNPMCIQGEPGAGKTTLLAVLATHERTRRRFRHIFWIDQPDRACQTLALALNLPHILMEVDPVRRREKLAPHLDDNTLLIIDNARPGDPSFEALTAMTSHVLLAVETEPEVLDPDEPLPDDPDQVVTVRALPESAAADALALHAGIEDTRRIRPELVRLVRAMGCFPYAIALAGTLARQDELSLNDLAAVLGIAPGEPAAAGNIDVGSGETLDAQPGEDAGGESGEESGGDDGDAVTDEALVPPHAAGLRRLLDFSYAALPTDYQTTFAAFGAFPAEGAPFDGLHAVARAGQPLATRRGLRMLERYGFVRRDHRDADRYMMHAVAYPYAVEAARQADGDLIRRGPGWAVRYARHHQGDMPALYHAEGALRHALALAETPGELHNALRDYLREYCPEGLTEAERYTMPELTGPRAESAQLTLSGIELTTEDAPLVAEEALTQALELREAHDSPHALAETLVALGRLYDMQGRFADAEKQLVRAAELVYELGADDSVSVIRRGLARVYRHMQRYTDALAVLDDAPEAHRERAAILRAQGHYARAVEEMDQAADATPYARAELYLLAGRYAEALEAIVDQDDPRTAHLRAQVYHLQGATEEAIRAYHVALDVCAEDDEALVRIYRGLGAALAYGGDYGDAREAFETALALLRDEEKPSLFGQGRTLQLLAAVHLAEGEDDAAIATAREALELLGQIHAPQDAADACRTLGRALWRQGDYEGALKAFQQEVEQAQGVEERDENRIGIALHHLGDAYRALDNAERATGNYRLAQSHIKADAHPRAYLVTQIALLRSLMEEERLNPALDVSQEVLDHLEAHPPVDLGDLGFALALRTRVQQAIQRPIRAGQTLEEWQQTLLARSEEALDDPRPALRVLLIGLAVRSLLAAGRPVEAEPLAEYALEVARTHFPDDPATWAATRDLGELLMVQARYEEAILALDPILDNKVKDEPATFALAEAITGRAYRAIGEPENALTHLRSALEWEPLAHLRALLYEAIGDLQCEAGLPADAVESYRSADGLFDRKAHAPDAARMLTTLAQTLAGLNRYGEAVGVYEEALIVLRDVPDVDPTHTGDVLTSLGQTHEAQGQLSDAAQAYRRALNILERTETSRQNRAIMHQLSRVTAQMGDPNAVLLYEQTIKLTEEWGEPRELGQALCELGDVHRDGDRLIPAIQYYQAALEHQSDAEFPRERVNTLRNLGRALVGMERYEEATQAWSEAITISHRLPDESPLEIALTYHAIAEAHRHQSHYMNAVKSYREALKHHKASTVEIAATWRALGQTLHAAGHFEEAAKALRYALEAEKAQPQLANARLVETLESLAIALEAGGSTRDAIARYHEALVYMDRDLQAEAYTETLRKLAALYGSQKDWSQAHKALQEALEIEMAQKPRRDERIAAALQLIADLYRDEGLLEKAAETYQKVTVYANLHNRASDDLRATLNELERRRATLQAAQQSLALLDRTDSNLKDLAFIYALIAKSHARLNQPEESAEAINDLLDELEARDNSLHTEQADPDYRALAWLRSAALSQHADDLATAREACDEAEACVQNTNLRWVIEQYARSLAAED